MMVKQKPHRSLNPAFTYQPTKLMDDIRVIDMYNDTIQNAIPAAFLTCCPCKEK